MSLSSKVLISSLSLISIVFTGFILSRLGRPYNQVIFNLHKIVALGAVTYTVIYIRQQHLLSNVGWVVIIPLLIAVLTIVVLFATGAMLNIDALDRILLRNIHLVTVIILVGALVMAILKGYES